MFFNSIPQNRDDGISCGYCDYTAGTIYGDFMDNSLGSKTITSCCDVIVHKACLSAVNEHLVKCPLCKTRIPYTLPIRLLCNKIYLFKNILSKLDENYLFSNNSIFGQEVVFTIPNIIGLDTRIEPAGDYEEYVEKINAILGEVKTLDEYEDDEIHELIKSTKDLKKLDEEMEKVTIRYQKEYDLKKLYEQLFENEYEYEPFLEKYENKTQEELIEAIRKLKIKKRELQDMNLFYEAAIIF